MVNETDPFENVHNKQDTINQPNGSGNFVQKVDVTRSVNEMNQVGLSSGGTEDERHGRGFEGDTTLARKDVRIGISGLHAKIKSCIGRNGRMGHD